MDYRVLLYYKYVTIDDPETFAAEHLKFCKEHHLKGRILVSTEGINGTLSGTKEDTDKYIEHMHADSRFADLTFKIDEAESHAFKKMHVRPRREIVALDLEEDINPREITGKYYSPKEFKAALEDENTVILDARNDYEYDLGHFRGAIRPDITRFRDLPEWVRNNKEQLDGKNIVTYCTGGIRCEKFSGWLVKEGFENVGQLHGGIATYGKDPETKGLYWDGKMYVFDERISVDVNQIDKTVIGKDHFYGTPCERYINCANPECNKQILVSEENEEKYLGACSYDCAKHERNRYVARHHISNEEWQRRLNNFKDVPEHTHA